MKQGHFLIPRLLSIFTLTVFLFALVTASGAQDADDENLEETLNKLSQSAAMAYVTPVVSAFGSNLNGGWFHSVPPAKMFGLKAEFGLVGMGTFFPSDDIYTHFSTSGTFRFSSTQAQQLFDTSPYSEAELDEIIDVITGQDFTVTIEGATIIGDSADHVNVTISGETVTVPALGNLVIPLEGTVDLGFGGLGDYLAGINFLPFAAPQLTVGTVLGAQATVRYIPEINFPLINITKDIGKFSWLGWGIQWNPGVLLPNPLPLDISLGYFTQTLKLGSQAFEDRNVIEARTNAFGLMVSKKLGIGLINISPYAGFLIEKSKMNFSYDFIIDEETLGEQTIPVKFELEGENKSRVTVGLSLKLFTFNLSADYNIGNYNSITFGLMVGI